LATPSRVLVVDDEPGVRSFFADVLRSAGYQVEEAGDGERALAAVETAPFDLVVTDLVMPNQEGIETIMALRGRYPRLKIIAVSGAFGGNMLTTAEALGADETLMKPVSPERLLETVRQTLEGAGRGIRNPE
jgi:CheY-like chemotaxis protein